MAADSGVAKCSSSRLRRFEHRPIARALVLAAAVSVLLVGPLALPAHAATSQGCSGSVTSALDKVTVPGPSGSNAKPFLLYWGEPVDWTGQTDQALTNGTWHLTVQNPSWLFALGEFLTGHTHGVDGTFDSGQGGTSFLNSFTPSSIEPLTLPGRYVVSFAVTGEGGADCTGIISVRVMDGPIHNPLWWLAFILLMAGLVMLFVFGISKLTSPVSARKRHLFANTLSGVFLGIGVSLMATLYGAASWSTTAPNLIILLGFVIGVGVGLLPERAHQGPTVEKTRSDYSSVRS
jgi:hypothetical protein